MTNACNIPSIHHAPITPAPTTARRPRVRMTLLPQSAHVTAWVREMGMERAVREMAGASDMEMGE